MVRVSLGLGSELGLGLGLGYGCKCVWGYAWLELTLPKILTPTKRDSLRSSLTLKCVHRRKTNARAGSVFLFRPGNFTSSTIFCVGYS